MSDFYEFLKWLFFFTRGVLSYFIPKEKNCYVILPSAYKGSFEGNSKALALYMNCNYPNIKLIILSDNKSTLKQAIDLGLKAKFLFSLSGFWYLFRAQFLLIDANRVDFFFGDFQVIQLWHGSGFKNVALLNEHPDVNMERLKRNYKKYLFILATSEDNRIQQDLSFGVKKSIVTGYPRNDFFFQMEGGARKIKMNYDLCNFRKIITYAPTFRDSYTSNPFSGNFLNKLDMFLKETNSILIIKKHPEDKNFKFSYKYKNIRDVTDRKFDIQELLFISDLLITDYSSVSTDFALLNRPIIIYAFDFEEYKKNCRSMYYNLDATLPKPIVRNENELIEKLMDLSWVQSTEVQESYCNFRNKFHKYFDGDSSKRVMSEILKLNYSN